MKKSIDLKVDSPKTWVEKVMSDFPSFLQDHADCERKASSMAMSFVAKHPDRLEIIPALIETALEELEHFQDVYKVMEKEGIPLAHSIGKDIYVNLLMKELRSGREERFMDRLLLASVLECRGAERFKLIAEALEPGGLKDFYKRLWISEAKHGHIFVDFALKYFDEKEVYTRLHELMHKEAEIILHIPIRAALH